MLEQAQASTTAIFSTRRGELKDLIAKAGGGGGASASGAVEGGSDAGGGGEATAGEGGSRVGRLEDFDGIVVVGGDGTFFEVLWKYCSLL